MLSEGTLMRVVAVELRHGAHVPVQQRATITAQPQRPLRAPAARARRLRQHRLVHLRTRARDFVYTAVVSLETIKILTLNIINLLMSPLLGLQAFPMDYT
jgi:hypothetical protein